jgi:hypothetical protein
VEFYFRILEAYRRLSLAGKVGLVLGMTLVATAAGAAVLILLPADHFTRRPARTSFWYRHPVMRWVTILLKNALGLLIVPLGLLMLAGPGPGLVFTLLGLSLLDIPKKRAIERWIISRAGVLRTINGLRARFGRPPVLVDEE